MAPHSPKKGKENHKLGAEDQNEMTKGRELPVNSTVRRRLFSEEEPRNPDWEGKEYLNRVVKTEYVAKNLKNEIILKGMKWNFDFVNERALHGQVHWYKKGDTGEWIGMEPSGRTISMRKRSREHGGRSQSTYEDERCKVRRLSQQTVSQRRGFFNDGRAMGAAMSQAEDDNLSNEFMDNLPMEYGGLFDDKSRPRWNTRDDAASSNGDLSEVADDENANVNILEVGKKDDKDDEEVEEICTRNHAMDKDEDADEREALYNMIFKNIGTETDKGWVAKITEQGTSTDFIETNSVETNTIITNSIETQTDRNYIDENIFGNMHISEFDTFDIVEQYKEDEANDMKEENEATPKSDKKRVDESPENEMPNTQVVCDKAKKKLYESNV